MTSLKRHLAVLMAVEDRLQTARGQMGLGGAWEGEGRGKTIYISTQGAMWTWCIDTEALQEQPLAPLLHILSLMRSSIKQGLSNRHTLLRLMAEGGSSGEMGEGLIGCGGWLGWGVRRLGRGWKGVLVGGPRVGVLGGEGMGRGF